VIAIGLAEQSYAIGLEHVQEVSGLPAEIARMPGTDAAMLGAFSWRGGLLPAVSLRALLGLPPPSSHSEQRMIVVRIGDARVGLLVDELRSIIHAPEGAIGPVPAVLNRGAGEGRIAAILCTSDGRGLISILAPEQLFRDESAAQILADGRQSDHSMAGKTGTRETESFVIFSLGHEEYGLPVEAIDTVVNLPAKLTKLPRAPAFVAGVINVRGDVIPVIEQRERFGVVADPRVGRRRVIVTAVGKVRAGFIVDDVREILEVPADSLRQTPELAAEAGRLFDRIADIEVSGRMILLVNPQQLLSRTEADLLEAVVQKTPPPVS